MLQIFLTILFVLLTVAFYQPFIIIPTAVIITILTYLRGFYLASSRAIKRAEGVAKSPIFSQLSTTLHGLTSLRAFRAEEMLRKEFDNLQVIKSFQ